MAKSFMGNGDTLEMGEQLISTNRKFNLRMQDDGNLVLYCEDTPIWATRTNQKGSPPYKLVMQEDNQLCINDGDNTCIWCTGTWKAGTGKAWCELLDNGNFFLYDGNAKKNPLWCTETEGGKRAPEEYHGEGHRLVERT